MLCQTDHEELQHKVSTTIASLRIPPWAPHELITTVKGVLFLGAKFGILTSWTKTFDFDISQLLVPFSVRPQISNLGGIYTGLHDNAVKPALLVLVISVSSALWNMPVIISILLNGKVSRVIMTTPLLVWRCRMRVWVCLFDERVASVLLAVWITCQVIVSAANISKKVKMNTMTALFSINYFKSQVFVNFNWRA